MQLTTYTKLRNGRIGLRCSSDTQHGERVRVRNRRTGVEQIEIIGRILWRTDDCVIAECASASEQTTIRPEA